MRAGVRKAAPVWVRGSTRDWWVDQKAEAFRGKTLARRKVQREPSKKNPELPWNRESWCFAVEHIAHSNKKKWWLFPLFVLSLQEPSWCPQDAPGSIAVPSPTNPAQSQGLGPSSEVGWGGSTHA